MLTRALPLALLLTACGAGQLPEPRIEIREVRVPYDDPACARAAVARLDAERPVYPDTTEALAGAATVFEGTQLLVAGRLLRIAREASIMAALRACAG